MKKTLKQSFKNCKVFLFLLFAKIKKIPSILGRDAFLFVIMFVLLDIVFGEFLFYQYVFLIKTKEPEIVSASIKFQENAYQSILKEWQDKDDIFKNTIQRNYKDPFFDENINLKDDVMIGI